MQFQAQTLEERDKTVVTYGFLCASRTTDVRIRIFIFIKQRRIRDVLFMHWQSAITYLSESDYYKYFNGRSSFLRPLLFLRYSGWA